MNYNKIKYQAAVYIPSSEMTRNTKVFFNDFVYKRQKFLSREEERDLLIKAKSGNKKAVERFFRVNQPLVYNVAKHYVRSSPLISLDDLIQEGNIGLMGAIERADPDNGARFATFAVFSIKRYCANFVSKTLYQREQKSLKTIMEFKRETEKFMHEWEAYPDYNSLYHRLNLHSMKIDLLKLVHNKSVYLDSPLGDNFNRLDVYPLEDPGFEKMNRDQLKKTVWQIIENLSPRQRDIAILFWGLHGEDPLMAKEVAKKLKMKHKSVEKILHDIRVKIRKYKDLSTIKSLMSA